MKLSEKHIEFRMAFRTSVIRLWGKNCRISDVVSAVSTDMGVGRLDVYAMAKEIPSIGRLSEKMRVDTWLGHSYPKVSEAMFSGDVRAAMTLFVTKNHLPVKITRGEKSSAKRFDKILKEIRTLNSEKPDRWAKTAWNVCK